ncbi:MAG: DNA replication/repair protein RecF [Clostridia bacterium]
MKLEKMNLTNFRNYENQEISFVNGINLFLGNNAQGKTNIIDAIYTSAFGKSYRTTKDIELVQFEKDFCRIELDYKKENSDRKIEVFIDKYNKKNIKQNGIKVTKLSNHVGEILVVMFSPESLDVVKGSPGKRRRFIDMTCCQLSKSYIITHQEYMKCLKLKNAILKKENIDKEYIYVLHEKMSEYIRKIVSFRQEVVFKLLNKAKKIHSELTKGKENIDLNYISDFINLSKEEIKKILDSHLYIDIMRKSCVKGIQRDDILININGLDVGKYGSQGQNRTALLTLKLSDFEVLIDEKEDTPILLLDDIMSELDNTRIQFLLKYIENYQSIITTTDANFVKDVKNIKISKVLNGTLEK